MDDLIKRTAVIPESCEWMLKALVGRCALCDGEFPREKKQGEIHITALGV
jgi:hypothetical protein